MPVQTLQSYAVSLAAHRLLLYVVFSLGAVAAVVANALKGQSNFYSVAVFLSRSNGSVVVLGNFGVLTALLCGRLLQQIFFGPLRALEVERLYDRTWFFVTESLLAFTIFRDEFDVPFASMFGLLLFTKCFHWLLSDRIEWMDQRPYPGPPASFHLRVMTLFSFLWVTDCLALILLTENMLAQGLDGKILFASELAVLLASLFNSFAKYLICIVDIHRASLRGGEDAPPWDDKSMWVFYVELCTDFLKLVTYLTFFILVLSVYGLPLNIVRDVYITGRSFIMRCRDLVNYRTATRNMDERYPDATDAELNALSDKTCIICREEMVGSVSPLAPDQNGNEAGQNGHPAANVEQGEQGRNNAQPPAGIPEGPNTVPKRLPCGHIFHFQCLRAWLERQQNCPTCRHSVFDQPRVNANQPPQNPLGAAQGQQAPQPVNAGGLFGRIVGAAGAPPIVPGQFAPGPGQAQPAQFGPAPIQNGALPLGPQHLPMHQLFVAQPERFEGFMLPNGNWIPWPPRAHIEVDRDIQADVPVDAPNISPSTTVGQSSGRDTDERPLNTASETDRPGSSQENLAVPDGSTSGTQDTSSASAREAARLAALRRFGAQTDTKLAPRTTGASMSTSTSTSANVASSSELPRAETRTIVAGLENTQWTSIAPAYVPLYDPSVVFPLPPPGHHATTPTSTPDTPRSSNQQTERRSSASPTTSTSATLPQPQPQPQSNSLNDLSRSQSRRFTRQSLRNLPAELSVEQLTSLDQLTRESIDERLRLLENVEAAAARCITELLRCRSVLPRSSPTPSQTTILTNVQDATQGASSQQPISPTRASVRVEGSTENQENPTSTHVEAAA